MKITLGTTWTAPEGVTPVLVSIGGGGGGSAAEAARPQVWKAGGGGTAAPKFREGDVCEFDAHEGPREVRITRVFDRDSYQFDHTGCCTAERLRLLRRPARVGDVLVRWWGSSMAGASTMQDDAIVASLVSPEWKHVDGTDIEPRTMSNRPYATILGHATGGRLVLASGSPQPTDDERTAYWAKIGTNQLPAESIEVRRAGLASWLPTAPLDGMNGGTNYATKDDIEALVGVPIKIDRTAAIARALFETDDEVTGFVHSRSETCGWDGTGTWEAHDAARRSRYDATMQRCWDRGHAGESPEWRWYVRAADRAKAMLESEKRRHPIVTVTR